MGYWRASVASFCCVRFLLRTELRSPPPFREAADFVDMWKGGAQRPLRSSALLGQAEALEKGSEMGLWCLLCKDAAGWRGMPSLEVQGTWCGLLGALVGIIGGYFMPHCSRRACASELL